MDDQKAHMMAPPLLEEDDVSPPVEQPIYDPLSQPIEQPVELPPEIPAVIPEEQKMDAFNIYKEGWLYKQSRYLKSWRRRWAVITRTHLYTYKLEQEYLLKGPG